MSRLTRNSMAINFQYPPHLMRKNKKSHKVMTFMSGRSTLSNFKLKLAYYNASTSVVNSLPLWVNVSYSLHYYLSIKNYTQQVVNLIINNSDECSIMIYNHNHSSSKQA